MGSSALIFLNIFKLKGTIINKTSHTVASSCGFVFLRPREIQKFVRLYRDPHLPFLQGKLLGDLICVAIKNITIRIERRHRPAFLEGAGLKGILKGSPVEVFVHTEVIDLSLSIDRSFVFNI